MPSSTDATPQRRPRRRKQGTITKENARDSNAADTTAAASKPRSRKNNNKRGDDSLDDDDITIDFSSNNDDALTKFQDAVAQTSSAFYWKRHASLAECVVRASQSLGQRNKTTSSLLLKEHASELTSTCRALVKDATQQDKDSMTKLTFIYVAIHGLRAICPILVEDTKKVEATLKILYHAVTTISDVCVKSKDVNVSVDAVAQCLAAFQALGFLLHGHRIQVANGKSVVTFKWKTSLDLFPVPSISSSSKASSAGGTMALEQVYKVGMQATLSVSNALAHLYTLQLKINNIASGRVGDFGPYTFELVQQSASYETIVKMTSQVTSRWTCFFSSEEMATRQNILQDSLTYAKRAFRLLFDVASQMDKCNVSPQDSLLLRKHAILAFLLGKDTSTLSQQAVDAIQKHHWEAACTYACKASVAYRSKAKQGGDDECLDRFHKDVGRVLDSFATDESSMAYIEYCAYRALHSGRMTSGACESDDCLFGQLGFRFEHNECDVLTNPRDSTNPSAMAGQVTLAVFFLVLTVQGELDAMASGKQSRGNQDWAVDDFDSVIDAVICSFRAVLVEAEQLPPYAVMNRCLKLLELLSLNRRVYHILSSKDTSRSSSRASLTALEISGRVLAESIAPLAVALVRCGDEEEKKNQHWELAADCYSRGLVVSDRIREQQLQSGELSSAVSSCRINDALRGLYDLCHDDELALQLSGGTLEKAAKTIFSIGRIRRDRKEYDQALLPLCLGNDLFSKLVEIRGPLTVHESQLSMRYSHLASTFSSLEMAEEACLALVLAIVYDMVASIASTQADDIEPIPLVTRLSSLANGVVLMKPVSDSRGSRSSFLGRLVCLSETLAQQGWSLPARSSREDFIVFIRRVLRASVGIQSEQIEASSDAGAAKPSRFSLATLLSSSFKENSLLRSAKKTRANAVKSEQLTVMADVVAEQGAVLHQEASADSSLVTVRLKEFNRSFQFLEWLAENALQDHGDSSQAPLALVHIIAAASLVPAATTGQPQVSKQQNKDSASLLTACKLLSRATEILGSALEQIRNKEQRLLSSTLLACATLYSSEISGANPAIIPVDAKNVILSSGQEAAQLLIEAEGLSAEARDSFLMCLTRTLTRFQDIANLEGDKLSAAQAALFIARIHDGAGTQDKSWYWAVADNLLQDSGLRPIAQDYLRQKHLRNQLVVLGKEKDLKDLIQFEMVATQSRMDMHSLESNDFKSASQEAQDLFDRFDKALAQPEVEPFTRIVVRWICGSFAMVLAEGAECSGAPNRAVDCLRQGINLCRESMSEMRKLRKYSTVVHAGDGDSSSAWADTALSTFLLRLTERRIAAQKRISTAYARLGDHRRSEAYAVGAAKECMLGGQDLSKQRLKINELAAIDRSQLHVLSQCSSYRLLLEMKTRASPSDRALESLHTGSAFDGILTATRNGHAADKVAWNIDQIWNLVNAGDLHFLSMGDPEERFKDFYCAADREMKALVSSPATAALMCSLSHQGDGSQVFESIHMEVKLRRARVLLLCEPSERNERRARDLLVAITETSVAPALCRAWAHYYLALINIKTARQSGALHDLWIDHAGGPEGGYMRETPRDHQDGKHDIATARSHLREALILVGPASDVLSRDVMRSLALLAGPSERGSSVSMSAASLIHSSIGATTRRVVTNVLTTDGATASDIDSSQSNLDSDEKLFHLFDSLDTSWSELSERNKRIDFLFDSAGESLPSNCRVVAVALCPTGEILVSSMCSSEGQSKSLEVDTVCIFPSSDRDSILDTTVYDDVMKPLDELIQRNEDQIRGLDTTVVADNFKEETSKRDWWNQRQRADDQLQYLIEDVESTYFSSGRVKRAIVGDDDEDDISISCGNLASKFEEARTVGTGSFDDESMDDEEGGHDDIHSMTVSELKDELEKLQVHVTTRKKPRKQQLIDMLIEARRNRRERHSKADKERCMVLILDENLHRYPFEGLEICSGWAVSRVPSLPFAIASLVRSQVDDNEETGTFPSVEPSEASYIVDPEGNLAQTKNRLVPAINDICESNDWNWKSVVGALPSQDFVQRALTRRNGLLLYCGHGGATCCFSRSQVEALINSGEEETPRRCRSTIILMGCSSGKLVSVNRKDSNITDKVTMFYEPEGIALSYLCAGAPCVVGNLWDVTDRDIDRYCMTLLETFLGADGGSLAKCVAEARSSCKMRHIVGLAPVCYGVPVHVLTRR